jgi:hypothetical protein
MPKWSIAALLLVGTAVVSEAQATEYGLSDHQQGLILPMTGYTPPPGVYFWDTFWLYQGSGNLYQNSNLRDPTRVTYNFRANIFIFAWFTDITLFGGELGLANISGYGSNTTTTVTPTGVGSHLTNQQTVESFGDTEFSAILGWHSGEQHWSLAVSGFVPTGDYDPQRIAQTSLNRPGLDIKGAYTFLSLQSGLEVTGALGITINGVNTATNYQSGAELHFEWALMEHLASGLAFGAGGYFYQQITNDSGVGDLVGPFRGRVAAVGPIIYYSLNVGEQHLDLSARWFHEFAAQNRVSGDTIYATLGFPLYSKPLAAMAAR